MLYPAFNHEKTNIKPPKLTITAFFEKTANAGLSSIRRGMRVVDENLHGRACAEPLAAELQKLFKIRAALYATRGFHLYSLAEVGRKKPYVVKRRAGSAEAGGGFYEVCA